ncbi:MAG: glycosyltransferase family 39 protein [Halobacteriota archaeon]
MTAEVRDVSRVHRRLPDDRPWELILAVVVGAVLRLHRLGAESLWIDEVFTVSMATEFSLRELLFEVPTFEPHPPLYNALMWGWVGLTGTSEAMVRLPSVAFSIATIPVLYLLVRRLFDRPTAAVATLLLAISPLQIWYAQEARMYALLVLLTVVSAYLLLRLVESYDRRVAVVYVLVGALLGYTHVYGLFVLLAQGLFAAWVGYRPAASTGWTVRRVGGLYGAIGLLTAPWTGLLVHRTLAPERYPPDVMAWLGPPDAAALVETFSLFAFGTTSTTRPYSVLSHPPEPFVLVVALTLVFVGGFYTLGAFDDHRRSLLFATLWTVVPVVVPFALSFVIQPMYELRYVIVAAPAFLVLVSLGVSVISLRHVRYGLLGLVVVGMLIPLPGYYAESHKDQWEDAADLVEASVDSDDVIIVVPGWTWEGPSDAFRYYFDRDDVAVHPIYDGSPDEAYTDAVADGDDVYLVLSYTNRRAATIERVSELTGSEPTERHDLVGVVVVRFESG